MTLDGIFRGIGDVLQATFRVLDADMGATAIMNTGIVCLGFIGLFYWLNVQRKFNAEAKNNSNQRK